MSPKSTTQIFGICLEKELRQLPFHEEKWNAKGGRIAVQCWSIFSFSSLLVLFCRSKSHNKLVINIICHVFSVSQIRRNDSLRSPKIFVCGCLLFSLSQWKFLYKGSISTIGMNYWENILFACSLSWSVSEWNGMDCDLKLRQQPTSLRTMQILIVQGPSLWDSKNKPLPHCSLACIYL